MSTDSPDTDQPQVEPVRFRFRIVHLLYATALIASALATFGFGGIYPAGVLLVGWTLVFLSAFESVARWRLDNCFRLVLFIIIALFPLPQVWRATETPASLV